MRGRYTSNYFHLPALWLLILVIAAFIIEYKTGGFFLDRLLSVQRSIVHVLDRSVLFVADKQKLYHRITKLEDENMQLSRQAANLRHQVALYQPTMSENVHLRRMLGIKSIVHRPLFTQPIRIFRSQSDQSVVAKRPQGDVKIGMLALNEDGIVIGRVASVSKHTLRILMLNDMKSALSVVVSDQYVNAVAVGNGSTVDLLHIPIDAVVKAGDIVRTVQTFQDGVNYQTLGRVASVQPSPDRTFMIAKLTQSSVLTSLQWLILI